MKAGWFIAGAAAALLLLEHRRPLRARIEPGAARIARNVAVGALTALVVSKLERPLVEHIARKAEARAWGITPHLPRAMRTAAALALMDYTLYWWHILLHRVPILWRTHEPHHIDRDLDTSTGIRFHFAEFVASMPWRCAQIVAIGVGPRTLALWQKLTLIEILFHHSNVRLPRAFERLLSNVVVTPRLHGVHHSIVREERDSNFSSGLTVWDRLHDTYRRPIQDQVTIGMPEHRREQDVTLAKTILLPFKIDPALVQSFTGSVTRI